LLNKELRKKSFFAKNNKKAEDLMLVFGFFYSKFVTTVSALNNRALKN